MGAAAMTHAAPPVPDGLRRPTDYLLAETIRVAVLFGGGQDDFVVPAEAPSSVVAAGLAKQIVEDRGDELAEDELIGVLGFEILGGEAINPEQTLAAAGVRDGDVLLLSAVRDTPSFTKVNESGSSAVAAYNKARVKAVSQDVAITMACWIMAAATLFTVGLTANVKRLQLAVGHDADWRPGVGLIGLAVLLAAAAAGIGWRKPRQRRVSTTLWGCALGAAASGAAIATPGHPGAPQVFIASAITAVGAALLWRKAPVGRGVAAGLTLAAVAAMIGSGLRMLFELPIPAIMVGIAYAGLILITFAPRVATIAAGLKPPPFPTVTGKMLYETSDQLPEDTLVPAEMVGGRPEVADQVSRANASNTYLTGAVCAGALLVVAGCAGLPIPGDGRWWLQCIFVAGISFGLLMRGRGFAASSQAITVVAAALLASAAAAARFAAGSSLISAGVAGGVLVVAALGAVLAVWVPVHVFAPTDRRRIVYLEYAVLTLLLPLALWIMGVYTFVRHS